MFDDLEAALGDSSYTPSFAPRTTAKKPFGRPSAAEPAPSLERKNSSNAPSVLEEETPAPRRTLMGLHKASSIESQREERPLTAATNRPNTSSAKKNDWDLPLPDFDGRPSTRQGKLTPPPAPEQPLSGYTQRGMKPPLNRKNSTGGFTAMNEEPTKEGFFSPPATAPHAGELNRTMKMNDGDLSKLKELYDEQTRSLKDFYEKQMHSEKSLLESRIKELKEGYDKDRASREIVHKEELASRLNLKELEINKLRQIHKMEMESKNEQLKQLQTLHEATSRAQRKTEVVEQWELKLKEQNNSMSQLLTAKEDQRIEKLTRQLAAREDRIGKREQEYEVREKEWRDSSRKEKENLQKEYERLQTLQETLLRKEKQLERDFQRQKEQLTASTEEQRRNYERKSQDLDVLRASMQHEKKLAEESREHYQKKMQQSIEERQQLLRECDQQKRTAVSKQVDLEGKLKVVVLREAQLDCLKEQLKGKLNLLELERKRLAAELSSAQRPELEKDKVLKTYLKPDQKSTIDAMCYQPALKKTLTELKNSYLEGFQHLRQKMPQTREEGPTQPKPFTFGRFYGAS